MSVTSQDLCTTCGHERFFHEKGIGDCLVGGLLDTAPHAFTGSNVTKISNDFFPHMRHTFNAVPIAYIKGDGQVDDEMVQANNGTWNGVEVYAEGFDGKFHGAMSCNSAGNVNLANEGNFDFDIDTPFSLSIWCKRPTPVGAVNTLISKALSTNPNDGWRVWLWNGDDKIRFNIDSTVAQYEIIEATTNFNDDLWHLYCCCFDGTSNKNGMRIYVDGVLDTVGTETAMSGTMVNDLICNIGAFSGNDSRWEGEIDEVTIFDYNLTPTLVALLYNNGNGLQVMKPPMTYIRVNTSEVTDSMPQGNNGTWTGIEAYVDGFDGTTNGAMDFDGASKVALANESNFDVDRTHKFSYSVWFKAVAHTGTLVAKNTAAANGFEMLMITGTGHILYFVRATDPTSDLLVSTKPNVQLGDNAWHHSVCTYDGSSMAAGLKVYIDGVLVALNITNDTLSTSILNNDPVTFGQSTGGLLPYTGALDEFAMFDYELTASDVAQIYNNGNGKVLV